MEENSAQYMIELYKFITNYIIEIEKKYEKYVMLALSVASAILIYGILQNQSIIFYFICPILLYIAAFYAGQLKSIAILGNYASYLETKINRCLQNQVFLWNSVLHPRFRNNSFQDIIGNILLAVIYLTIYAVTGYYIIKANILSLWVNCTYLTLMILTGIAIVISIIKTESLGNKIKAYLNENYSIRIT